MRMETLATIEIIKATVTAFCAGKFKGRTALLRLIEAGDETAVRAMALPTQQARVHAALRGELSHAAAQAVAKDELAAQARLRERRALLRKPTPSCLAERITYRQPGNALARCTRKAFFDALKAASFATAKHSHQTNYYRAKIGAERAASSADTIGARDAGLPNAYAKKGYSVASSTHTFEVSPAILRVARHARAKKGMLYLSPTLRVRQGRGTSLRTERLNEQGKWA